MPATHIVEQDLIHKQADAERELLREFESGDFTLENPLIKLNPYDISPLAALVMFRTPTETAVTITVRGRERAADIAHTFPAAKTHILPVIGLYPACENTVEIALYQGRTTQVHIKTEPAGAGVPQLISYKRYAPASGSALTVLSPPGGTAMTGFDCCGDVRWYLSTAIHMDVKRLKNGRLLAGTHRTLHPPYSSTGLYEFDMVGKIYKEYLLPGGYHHDEFEMPNGDLLVLTQEAGAKTVEDVCVLVDRQSGDIKKTWNFADFITPGDGKSGKWTESDWFHCNAVWYDEKTHSITFSGRHIDAMVNIDFDSGSVNWIIGDPEGWSEGMRRYFFTPQGSDFMWQYAQHACLHTPDGDVMCFDNGTLRSKIESEYLPNSENYSRAVRYAINTEDMTIKQVWEFGKEMGSEFFSQHISNVEYLGEYNYLIHSGGIMLRDGIPVEDLMMPGPGGPDANARNESATVETDGGVKVMEMRVKGNYFRAKKFTPYYDGANLELGAGVKLGNLGLSKRTAAETEPEPGGELPEECMAHVIEQSDQLTFKARFALKSVSAVVLRRGEEQHRFAVNTEGGKFAGFVGLPHLEADERNTSMFISKYGLSGEYAVWVETVGKIYDAGVTVSA